MYETLHICFVILHTSININYVLQFSFFLFPRNAFKCASITDLLSVQTRDPKEPADFLVHRLIHTVVNLLLVFHCIRLPIIKLNILLVRSYYGI